MKLKSMTFDWDRHATSYLDAINNAMSKWRHVINDPKGPNQLTVGWLDIKNLSIVCTSHGQPLVTGPREEDSIFGLRLVVKKDSAHHWELGYSDGHSVDVEHLTQDNYWLKKRNEDLEAKVKQLNDILTD